MKKCFIKILELCLWCVILVFMFDSSVYAKTNADSVYSIETSEEMNAYAERIVIAHLYALYGEYPAPAKYQMGQAFTVVNVVTEEFFYFYPIICNDEIVLLLQVSQDINTKELSSALCKSFSDEIDKLLEQNFGRTYWLITDGNHVQAYDGEKLVDLFRMTEENDDVDLSNRFAASKIKGQVTVISKENIINENANVIADNIARSSDGPAAYKTINVVGIKQSSENWCWAATCAALINYYKGVGISDATVAQYVFPTNPDQQAKWENMQKAYLHWGLTPSQTSMISFSNVKSYIDINKPMHLGLIGHSVGLIGYEDWRGPDCYDKILILMEPDTGGRVSVTLKSNGDFSYNGYSNSWIYTRIF